MVLPTPLGPIMATHSPRITRNEKSRRMVRSPYALKHAVQFRHELARGGCCVEGHRRRALALYLARAFGAQLGQRAHPALIAFAAGRDAFDRPARFGLDLAVQLVAGIIFFRPDLVAPVFEPVEPSFAAAHLAPGPPKAWHGSARAGRRGHG